MTGNTVTLGGREFTVAPLKLGQLRTLLDALDDLSGKTGGAVIDAAARVIQAALGRAVPELTIDAVLELEATMDEVTEAVTVILDTAGLSHREGVAPGEARPVASLLPETIVAAG